MGLLSPVTIGYDDDVTDAAILDALVTVEVALVRAYGALGVAPTSAVESQSTRPSPTGTGSTRPRWPRHPSPEATR